MLAIYRSLVIFLHLICAPVVSIAWRNHENYTYIQAVIQYCCKLLLQAFPMHFTRIALNVMGEFQGIFFKL